MGIKERLFGPRWQHKDPAVRLQSVREDQDERLFEQLSTIAHHDQDPQVRLAALRRLDHQHQWLKTSMNDPDTDLRSIADQWLIRAVQDSKADGHLADRLRWLESIQDNKWLRTLARSAQDLELREAALLRIEAQGFLGDCFASEPDDGLADRLLKRIHQISTLKRISQQLRKKNKRRQEAVLHRLAELQATSESDTDREASNALAFRLLEQLEQLARGAASDNRAKQLEQIQRQWQQLNNPEPALVRRFQTTLHVVELAMDERRRPKPDASDNAIEEANQSLSRLADELQVLLTAPGDTNRSELNSRANALRHQFDQQWSSTQPDANHVDIKQRFDALWQEHQSRLMATASTKPAKQPAARKEATKDPGPELLAQLDTALDELKHVIEEGDVALAQTRLGNAHSLFDRIPKKHRSSEISGRLSRLSGKVRELRNWQHWSNNELRERLIEHVEQIDVETLHPDAVTARLKELRERWKALDEQETAGQSKRKFAAPANQWRRFQNATQKAFEAARPFLDKRSEVQQSSLEELEVFLEEAQPVAEAQDTERSQLIRYQRAARTAIRNLNSLPPKQRGRMAGELRSLMDRISSRLDAQFEQSEQDKRRLVAEARKLEHAKDRDSAIEQAKALQAEWKKIPPARRKIDQQLWNEFRQPIDPLFSELKQERQQQKEQDQERLTTLKALCKQAEELAESDVETLDNAAGPLAGLEQQWSELAAPAGLNQRFNQAVARFHERISERDQQHQAIQSQQLIALAEALQQCWTQLDKANGPVNQPKLEWPDNDPVADALANRLMHFCDPSSDLSALRAQVDELTEQARQVVIEMETLSGLETPEQDRKQRMDYQVKRLSERLGQGSSRKDATDEREQLLDRWLRSFPHHPADHEELSKRFASGDTILKNMTAS